MDEYVCLTVLSRPGEPEKEFAARLTAFWTRVLRELPDDYEKVYAEAKAFERAGERTSRRYLAEEGAVDTLERELRAAGVDFEPVDRDDLYSKYEAAPSEWMQIDH